MIKQSALWLNLVRNQCTALNFLVDITISKSRAERISVGIRSDLFVTEAICLEVLGISPNRMQS
jgi:hypothetical protein